MVVALDNYYDLDAILAENERFPCIITYGAPDLGFLTDKHDKDVKENESTTLPFWLIETLAEHELIELKMPICYGIKVKADLMANPTTLPLSKLSQYYFAMGARLSQLVIDNQLIDVLVRSFNLRQQLIFDYTQASFFCDHSEFVRGLDRTELSIYKSGQESTSLVQKWFKRGLSVSTTKKRNIDISVF